MRQYFQSRQDLLALIADLGGHLLHTTQNGGHIDYAAEENLLKALIKYEKIIHEKMEHERQMSDQFCLIPRKNG